MGRGTAIALLTVAMVLAGVLFVPPVIGLANNGDYGKVSLHYGLFSPNEEEFQYAPQTHRFLPEKQWDSGIFTSTHLPVLAALALHRLSGAADFDARWLGAVYSSLFLLAVAIVHPCLRELTPRRRWLFHAALVLMLCDITYIALFNTFFMDTTALAGLILAAAAWLRYRVSGHWGWLVLFVAAGLLAVLSKSQHVLLAVPMAALAMGRNKLAGLVLLAGCVFGFTRVNAEYAPITVFNVVFYSILPASPAPEEHLRELGFDASWKKWIGTHAYDIGSRLGETAFAKEITDRCSQARVARFLATHPAITWRLLISRLSDAAFVRPPNLSNYDRSAGRAPMAQSAAFSLASAAKVWAFLGHPLALGIWIVVLLAGALACRSAETVALAGAAAVAFGVGAFGDSLDVARHLTVFQLLMDMILLALFYTGLTRARIKGNGNESVATMDRLGA